MERLQERKLIGSGFVSVSANQENDQLPEPSVLQRWTAQRQHSVEPGMPEEHHGDRSSVVIRSSSSEFAPAVSVPREAIAVDPPLLSSLQEAEYRGTVRALVSILGSGPKEDIWTPLRETLNLVDHGSHIMFLADMGIRPSEFRLAFDAFVSAFFSVLIVVDVLCVVVPLMCHSCSLSLGQI